MIGSNTIILNEASMKLAIQHYFDTMLFKQSESPKVIAVNSKNTDGFEVKVKDNAKDGA